MTLPRNMIRVGGCVLRYVAASATTWGATMSAHRPSVGFQPGRSPKSADEPASTTSGKAQRMTLPRNTIRLGRNSTDGSSTGSAS